MLTGKPMYVVGFMFCLDHVLLVKKTRPDWQAGLWNGVGGSCNPSVGNAPSEHPHVAMPREFKEETGIETAHESWINFATEVGPDYLLYCYKTDAIPEKSYLPKVPAVNDVGEQLAWWPLDILAAPGVARAVGNLRWMIPFAQDWRMFSDPTVFITKDDIRNRPTW
jgi:8-oxo-dGTP pyrophosphatase MutT (NUDIX family)